MPLRASRPRALRSLCFSIGCDEHLKNEVIRSAASYTTRNAGNARFRTMPRSIVILSPKSTQFDDLHRAFKSEVGDGGSVALVPNMDDLRASIAGDLNDPIALVPLSCEGQSGLELIAQIRSANADSAVVIVAEKSDIDANAEAIAAEAIAAGANDFLVRGPRLRERVRALLGKLHALLQAVDERRQLGEYQSQIAEALQARRPIIGESLAMRDLIARIERVARVPRPVLILGERGTGKELVARGIHFSGPSKSRPLVTINCAAFNDALLESELFGHEKGAFTGADAARRGKFELADGGTLFLDEIGNMSLSFQQKILRVVEYGVYQRVGGNVELKTTARIVAATNCDLRERIRQGKFLPDLYDRLSFEELEVPPLRSRGLDIDLLAQFFLDRFRKEAECIPARTLSSAALAALRAYSFPGNVRELKTIIERAAYRESGPEITVADLSLSPQEVNVPQFTGTFEERVDAYSKQLLSDALQQAEGNQAQAARLLGMSYHQWRYFAKKYQLDG